MRRLVLLLWVLLLAPAWADEILLINCSGQQVTWEAPLANGDTKTGQFGGPSGVPESTVNSVYDEKNRMVIIKSSEGQELCRGTFRYSRVVLVWRDNMGKFALAPYSWYQDAGQPPLPQLKLVNATGAAVTADVITPQKVTRALLIPAAPDSLLVKNAQMSYEVDLSLKDASGNLMFKDKPEGRERVQLGHAYLIEPSDKFPLRDLGLILPPRGYEDPKK